MSSPTFAKLVEPIQKPLMAITEVKDKNRGHKQFNHLSTVAEGVPAFGWIAVVSWKEKIHLCEMEALLSDFYGCRNPHLHLMSRKWVTLLSSIQTGL
jgi:hypothetical protein